MRKMSKIILMLVLVLMLVLSYSQIANAATEVDYSGYSEIADETPNNDAKKEETAKEEQKTDAQKTTEDKKDDIANKATEPHSQAGSFETKAIVSIGAVVLVLAGVGYIKYKKYNY